jgi:hypothetical protein
MSQSNLSDIAFGLRTVRTPIAELSPAVTNAQVIGFVLKKTEIKEFVDKKTGLPRHRCTFLIRDRTDTCSVVCWGDCVALCENFAVGDIVAIEFPSVVIKNMYSLSTTCQFELHLNNKDKCRVYKYTMGKDIATLQLHKPPANAEIVPLESLPEIVEGTEVNLLAMVRKIFPTQTVNTRKGTTVTKRTIVCFDQHCFDFPITFWGEDTQIVDGFKENETVLFFTSIRLRSFQGKYSGTFQQSSTVMSNPRTPAAIGLYKWSKRPEVQGKLLEMFQSHHQNMTRSREPSFNEIHHYYTIAQFAAATSGQQTEPVFGFTIAALFKLDLRAENLYYMACSYCKRKVSNNDEHCCSLAVDGAQKYGETTVPSLIWYMYDLFYEEFVSKL